MPNNNDQVTPTQVVTSVALVALVLFLMLAFQTVQIMRDRSTMHQMMTQQDKPLEDSRKIQAQLSALALGTKKLADTGDKNAAAIIARLNQLGISVGTPAPAAGGATAPVAAPPAATPADTAPSETPAQ